jgi:hypothetical protein
MFLADRPQMPVAGDDIGARVRWDCLRHTAFVGKRQGRGHDNLADQSGARDL